jgi:hypothetical protein
LRNAGFPRSRAPATPDAVSERPYGRNRLREITLKKGNERFLMRAVSRTALQKIPYTVGLSPRQSRFVEGEAKHLQISVAEAIRQLIDREITRLERLEPEKTVLRA